MLEISLFLYNSCNKVKVIILNKYLYFKIPYTVKNLQLNINNMTELTTQKILEIHDVIIEHFGGTKGVLYSATIDHLVYKLNKKNNVFDKASITY
jgi:hypothetical protein